MSGGGWWVAGEVEVNQNGSASLSEVVWSWSNSTKINDWLHKRFQGIA